MPHRSPRGFVSSVVRSMFPHLLSKPETRWGGRPGEPLLCFSRSFVNVTRLVQHLSGLSRGPTARRSGLPAGRDGHSQTRCLGAAHGPERAPTAVRGGDWASPSSQGAYPAGSHLCSPGKPRLYRREGELFQTVAAVQHPGQHAMLPASVSTATEQRGRDRRAVRLSMRGDGGLLVPCTARRRRLQSSWGGGSRGAGCPPGGLLGGGTVRAAPTGSDWRPPPPGTTTSGETTTSSTSSMTSATTWRRRRCGNCL